MSPSEKTQLLQWIVKVIWNAFPGDAWAYYGAHRDEITRQIAENEEI